MKIELEGYCLGDFIWASEEGDIAFTGSWNRFDGCSAVDMYKDGVFVRRLSQEEASAINEEVGDAIDAQKDEFFENVARDCRHSNTPLEDVI